MWINIEDKLPEDKKNVLGFDKNGCRMIVFYLQKYQERTELWDNECELEYDVKDDEFYHKEGWYEELEQFGGVYDVVWTPRYITHWMPLPKPPEI